MRQSLCGFASPVDAIEASSRYSSSTSTCKVLIGFSNILIGSNQSSPSLAIFGGVSREFCTFCDNSAAIELNLPTEWKRFGDSNRFEFKRIDFNSQMY